MACNPLRARRIRQLEEAGDIPGCSVTVDGVRLALRVGAFAQVRLERHTGENVARFR